MSGARCYLAPLNRQDMGRLYQLSVLAEGAATWRYHGGLPPMERFDAEFWNGVHEQVAIRKSVDDSLVGYATSYQYNAEAGFCYVAVIVGEQGLGIGTESTALFCQYLFDIYNLRKVYFEVPDFNVARIGGLLETHGTLEATLPERFFAHGRWCDVNLYTVSREQAAEGARSILAAVE